MKTAKQLLDSKGSTIYSVPPSATVYEALVIMAQHRVGALLVLDAAHLVGIFSERDYAREVVLKGKTTEDTLVAEIMSTKLITVDLSATTEHCMNLMSGKRIRHLPIVENGQVLGVLSIGDLVQATIDYQQFLIKQLESYIQS